MQIVKKQKALEPKTSKKTNSPRAEKKVFSIDNSSNRDIKEDRKKAYNFENVVTFKVAEKLSEKKKQIRQSYTQDLGIFFEKYSMLKVLSQRHES